MKPCFQFRHICLITLYGLATLLVSCGNQQESSNGIQHGAAQDAQDAQEFERGPHNGRLLRDGNFSLEITIFETGVPPEFRIYPYQNNQAIPPGSAKVTVTLQRLGDRLNEFQFDAQGDFLRGGGIVLEPHSFEVTVNAQHSGKQFQWRFDSYEGRTQIDPTVAQAMGIEVAQATGETIRDEIELLGTMLPDPNAMSEIRGRFSGIILSLKKEIGDSVQQGEALATVQSNESMQTYTVTAPRAGTVIARDATVGSALSDNAIYVVADMSRLIVDLKVYARDLGRIAVDQEVLVSSLDGESKLIGKIYRILPTLDAASRAATARILMVDAGPDWRPGQFVRGKVLIAEHPVSLAVLESGLQSFRDFTVVYARVGDTYEVRMLELGRRDGQFVEVLGGLEPGTTYVTDNSYLVKADIEKSGASHDH